MTNTVVLPGPDGGLNWGGGSYDPRLSYYFINSHDRGAVQKMLAQVPATGGLASHRLGAQVVAINVNSGDVA